MQVQSILAFGNEDSFLGQCDGRIGWIRDVGEKNIVPDCATLRAVHILHVEDELGEAFVENAGLHFVRDLRTFELVFKATERGE